LYGKKGRGRKGKGGEEKGVRGGKVGEERVDL